MSIDEDRELLSKALEGLNLSAALGDIKLENHLRFVQARERASVWSSNIFTRTARVPITLIVYALRRDPAALADFEEELTLLKALGDRDDLSGPRLLFSHRASEIGLLITADASDARTLQAAGEQPALVYNAASDRIIGGDRIEARGDHWIRLCLLSQSRGERLVPLLTAAAESYAKRADPADPKFLLPAPLALVALEPIAIPGVPDEYQRLAQLALVISDSTELSAAPGDRATMARRLLTIVAAIHAIGVSLSAVEGSCISRGNLTPAGGIIDAYYMTQVGPTPGQRRVHFRHDLREILAVISESTDGAHLEAALMAAVTAYTEPASPAQSLVDQARNVAELLSRPSRLVVDPLNTLADVLFAASAPGA